MSDLRDPRPAQRNGHPQQSLPPVDYDTARDEVREEFRDDDYIRIKPRDPSQKYELPRGTHQRGMDYLWASTRVPFTNLKNKRLDDFRRAGWKMARAADFPELSHYKPQQQANRRLIELGLEEDVRADDPVILDNLVLLMRPKALTQEAERERDQLASNQINDHLRRQRERSEREIGKQYTQMRRHYGPSDEAPSDQDTGGY